MDLVGRFHLKDVTELKCLTGIDDHSRYCVSARLMVRATARPVCVALKAAFATHGIPEEILTDNGKVFTNRFGTGTGTVLFDKICAANDIKHRLTAPYSPTTTGKVERFHRTLRREFFSKHDYEYETLEEAQAALDAWVTSYNTERPHQSLGDRPPAERFSLRPALLPELAETDLKDERPEDLAPGRITRRVDKSGRIRLDGFSYTAGRYLAGEVVVIVSAGGLLELCHDGEIVATHARHHRPGKSQKTTTEVRHRRARPATTGPSVTRVVDASGSVSFAGASYRVGNAYKRLSVRVAIVARSVQISLDGELLKTHPIHHDRAKEFGAFATPNGRPRNAKGVSEQAAG
jgi:hypothetical protein